MPLRIAKPKKWQADTISSIFLVYYAAIACSVLQKIDAFSSSLQQFLNAARLAYFVVPSGASILLPGCVSCFVRQESLVCCVVSNCASVYSYPAVFPALSARRLWRRYVVYGGAFNSCVSRFCRQESLVCCVVCSGAFNSCVSRFCRQESLEALRYLPEGNLFDEEQVSPVWLEVVDKAGRFLRSVVLG